MGAFPAPLNQPGCVCACVCLTRRPAQVLNKSDFLFLSPVTIPLLPPCPYQHLWGGENVGFLSSRHLRPKKAHQTEQDLHRPRPDRRSHTAPPQEWGSQLRLPSP